MSSCLSAFLWMYLGNLLPNIGLQQKDLSKSYNHIKLIVFCNKIFDCYLSQNIYLKIVVALITTKALDFLIYMIKI